MEMRKPTQKERYMYFLSDVYNGEKANTLLCRQHGISTNTVRSLKELKLVNEHGINQMLHEPNKRIINMVIKHNYRIQKEYKHKQQYQIPTVQSKPKEVKPSKVAHKEINLFWGMIKIVR